MATGAGMTMHTHSYPLHTPVLSRALALSSRRLIHPFGLPFPSPFLTQRHHGSDPQCRAVVASDDTQLQNAKYSLLKAVQETERGFNASPDQRAVIEEFMVDVEAFDAGAPLDLNTLDGTWLLQYTTASDVLSILQAAQLPFLKVGQIFQKFECHGNSDEGLIRNVVRWSVPGVLQDVDGATLTVTAKFYVARSRNIALEFQEAAVGEIIVSEELQAFIAPALLPRTFLNLEVLQLLRGFSAKFPLRGRAAGTLDRRPPLGLLYYISFVDNSMLLGRALGSGGVFIFSKTQPLQSHVSKD